ncbi:MAG: M28 family metallopeptidase [Candidatus Bathyarchaeia archaeon]
MKEKLEICEALAFEHVDYLCNVIGNRYVGTDGERRTASYIASKFREYGLSKVSIEGFKAPQSLPVNYELRVPSQGGRVVECYPYGFCSSTAEEGLTAPLKIADPVELKGKNFDGSIVLAAQVSPMEAIDQKSLKGLIVADMTPWPTYHSLHSAYFLGRLPPPSVSISLQDAYAIIAEGISSAYLRIVQRIQEALSRNVFAYLPGDGSDEFVILCAHFDSVPVGGCGADNAGGVAVLLELARSLASQRLKRGVLFLAFGAEEVGSIGSLCYAKRHSSELEDCLLVMNIDGGGAILGRNFLRVTGPSSLVSFASSLANRMGYPAVVGPSPGGDDTLAFNALGIPSIYNNRNHYNTHSHRDSSKLLGSEALRLQAEYSFRFVMELTKAKRLPFRREVPKPFLLQARNSLNPYVSKDGYEGSRLTNSLS